MPGLEVVRIASAQDVAVAGLPGWLYSLMGALAGLCLGGACLPARAGRDQNGFRRCLGRQGASRRPDYVIKPQILPDTREGEYDMEEEEPARATKDLPRPVTERKLPAPPVFEDYYNPPARADDQDEDGWAVKNASAQPLRCLLKLPMTIVRMNG